MAKHNKQPTPEEKYEEAAIELAVYRLLREDCENAAKPLDDETEKQLKQQYERTLPQRMALIDRETRRHALKHSLRKTIPQVLKIAVVIILVLNLGLTISVASSDTVRAYVMEFLVQVNDEYAEIGFFKTDTTIAVPEGWNGSCYPSYIPEGFTIKQLVHDDKMSLVLYQDQNNRHLTFVIYCNEMVVNIDSENAKASFIEIQGVKATAFETDTSATLIWQYGDQFIELQMTGTMSEVLIVADSIRNIKN